MKVIDLCLNFQESLWIDTVKQIESSNDELKNNYLNLNFSDFLSFPCVIDNDRIVAFSGLQYSVEKWGSDIARCSSRMWIHPDYRINNLKKFKGGSSYLNSYYCVPHQITIAKQKNLNVIFVSKEKNYKGFVHYLKLLTDNTAHRFIVANDKYWVCGSCKVASCLQYVGICYLNVDGIKSWNDSMRKFSFKF